MKIWGALLGVAVIVLGAVLAVGSWFVLGLPRGGSEIAACVMAMLVCLVIIFSGYLIISVTRD